MTAAILALHQALFFSNSLVLLLSPSLRQSAELFRTIAASYHRLPTAMSAEIEQP